MHPNRWVQADPGTLSHGVDRRLQRLRLRPPVPSSNSPVTSGLHRLNGHATTNRGTLYTVAAEFGTNTADTLAGALASALGALDQKIDTVASSSRGFRLVDISHTHSLSATESGAHVCAVVSVVAVYEDVGHCEICR